jgi:hypothetical protein
MSTRTIHLYGAKGGVGTSTVAVLIAAELAAAGEAVHLSGRSQTEDLGALLGLPPSESQPYQLGPAGEPTARVYDWGTDAAGAAAGQIAGGGQLFLVTRSCYLALRRALAQGVRPDGIILLAEPERSLGAADVVDILGVRVVAEIPVEPRIARSVDAGILGRVRPRSATRPLHFLTASRVS